MPAQRNIRWANVEYQPNFLRPTSAIPLGIVAEEVDGSTRKIVLVGREPRGDIRALQLDQSAGPFHEIVAHWFENFLKSLHDCLNAAPAPGPAVIVDTIAQQWRWNVYVTEPTDARSSRDLVDFAVRKYKAYAYPTAAKRTVKRRSEQPPVDSWIRQTTEMAPELTAAT